MIVMSDDIIMSLDDDDNDDDDDDRFGYWIWVINCDYWCNTNIDDDDD